MSPDLPVVIVPPSIRHPLSFFLLVFSRYFIKLAPSPCGLSAFVDGLSRRKTAAVILLNAGADFD
jgi:hypothetical protein